MKNNSKIRIINKILQHGGHPLYPEHLELPDELTIRIFEFLTIQQLLLLLDDDDTRYRAINAIRRKLLHHSKIIKINDLLLLFNHPLFRKIIILFIIKELKKPSVSLLFVQDVYINIKNKGIIKKIILMIDNLYYSMFSGEPPVITQLMNDTIVNPYIIKLSYIRIFKAITEFFEMYPEGIRGTQSNNNISYKFNIEFSKPEYSKMYIITPGYTDGDCYISTVDYIWQILEESTPIMLYNKLVELINNSFEYSYILNSIELFRLNNTLDTSEKIKTF